MLLITVNGIVIRERQCGENDKFIDIMTDKCGLMEVFVRGARKITSKNASSAQLFAYSKFCLSKRRDRYCIDSAEPIKIFYSIRQELDKLALASYFAEVISYASMLEENRYDEILRLLLNVFHYLSEGTREIKFLKSIFELRFMTEIGNMPNVLGCAECNMYSAEKMYFIIENGTMYCSSCFSQHKKCTAVSINDPVLHAIRHIVLADFNRLFNFRLPEISSDTLAYISENYLITHIGKTFKTLEFYKTVVK